MPDVVSVEIAEGRMEPLPDFIHYLRIAEKWHCPPAETLDGKGPPKSWWRNATMVLAAAESDAQRRSRKRG